jgi:hypothetical protein
LYSKIGLNPCFEDLVFAEWYLQARYASAIQRPGSLASGSEPAGTVPSARERAREIAPLASGLIFPVRSGFPVFSGRFFKERIISRIFAFPVQKAVHFLLL